MKNPSVCAIMLENGREEMVKRAIKSFREQTYPKELLSIVMFDTAPTGAINLRAHIDGRFRYQGVSSGNQQDGRTIGELRNVANSLTDATILAHWDSDDFSHPRRIEEQVALLQASGKECVGYSDMLFWDETPGQFCEAWMWNNRDKRSPIGTSLMYRRSAWERVPFLARPDNSRATGEEYDFLKHVDAVAVSSVASQNGLGPRMIASIHGNNTTRYDPADYVANQRGTSWKRAAEFDNYCRRVMAL